MTREEAIKTIMSAAVWTDDEREALDILIPELKESEDERIRKVIYKLMLGMRKEIFTTQDEIVTKDKALAYLEKQKEPHYTKRNALFDKCVENCDPKTVEEVNKRVDDIMNMPELSAFEQALTNFIGDWEDDEERWPSKFVKKHGKHILDMAKEELQKEQKPVVTHGETYHVDTLGTQQVIAGKMPQKPAEWSEEDEEVMEDLYNFVTSDFIQDHIHETRWKPWKTTLERNRQNRLKSLRPSWKPSEEQMMALLNAEGFLRAGLQHDSAKTIAELYEQLKSIQ